MVIGCCLYQKYGAVGKWCDVPVEDECVMGKAEGNADNAQSQLSI